MLSTDERERTQTRPAGLDLTIEKAQANLLRVQYPDGYWWGELESNPTMEAEYLLLTHFLGGVDPERRRKPRTAYSPARGATEPGASSTAAPAT